ncbi:EcsC family protein [Pseudalkalibacillus hwajinpoensis]|uniref:EcsC family protein n=1 Tax=Guptibacillus hwajinpoensis TaxID=208199 RepID=UPI00325B92C1
MNDYYDEVKEELESWERSMKKKSSMFSRSAKNVQTRINRAIPERVHALVTNSVKTMVQAVLKGNTYTVKEPIQNQSMVFRDKQARQAIVTYKRVAAAEGAGTGAGGIFLGLADFPLLLSIKMKMLFDIASIYGYDAKKLRERVFILHVFQLAFSSNSFRKEVYKRMQNWDQASTEKNKFNDEHDWKAFQMEYRDYIDLPKFLQMIPGIGAVVGALVNYHFIDWLGENAMNAYRQRIILSESVEK